jgi:biopolymer transport protein ExbD
MALERKRKRHIEVATGALSDIMFFLLLFFLIISTLANPNVIKVPLPESHNTQKTNKSHLTLSVQYVNEEYIYCFDKDLEHQIKGDDNELLNQLKSRTAAANDDIVVVRFDKNAQAQKLVDLFEIAKEANVKLRLGTNLKK